MKRVVSFVLFIIVLLNIMTAGACKNEPHEEETTTRPVFTEAVETPEQKAAREAYKENPLDYVEFTKSTGVREIYISEEDVLNYSEETFNIFETNSNDSNFLKVVEEYDNYNEDEVPDYDLIKEN